MARAFIPYGRQDVTEDDIREVVDCLRSDFLTQGPRVAAFEDSLREATGARHAIAVANGTAALHLAYLAVGMGPGDVGVTTPVSFVATSNGMLYTGADVAFADVEPTTGLIDVGTVEKLVGALIAEGRAPKVITTVDLAGQPAERVAIRRIAEGCGARVLEDAAHSLGASYNIDGRTYRVGSCAHADAAILSFHPVKHVTTGEGGAIVTNDDGLASTVRDLRTHGIHKDPARLVRPADDPFAGPWYYEQSSLGFNYRITDIQCALGVSQMKRLGAFVARRQEIAARYDAALVKSEVLVPAARLPGRAHAHHLYVVQVKPRAGESAADVAWRRKAFYLRLAEQKIHCQVHYIPIPWQPFYTDHPRVRRGTYPGAEAYYAASISIPMFPAMTDEEVDDVIAALERASAE